jgi:excisionase family DNA binding protein
MPSPKLLTIPETAALLSLGQSTIWEYISLRKLDVVRMGRAVRISETEVARLVERNTVHRDPRWERR